MRERYHLADAAELGVDIVHREGVVNSRDVKAYAARDGVLKVVRAVFAVEILPEYVVECKSSEHSGPVLAEEQHGAVCHIEPRKRYRALRVGLDTPARFQKGDAGTERRVLIPGKVVLRARIQSEHISGLPVRTHSREYGFALCTASVGVKYLLQYLRVHVLELASGDELEAVRHVLRRAVFAAGRAVVCGGVDGAGGEHDGAQQRGGSAHPGAGTLPAQEVLYAPRDAALAKGQRHGERAAPARGEAQQRGRVVGAHALAQLFQYRLVAAHLHVAPRQHEGQPRQRVEPVQAQRNEGQGLEHMVSAPDVLPLVEHYVLALGLADIRGQVYLRPEDTQHEGRVDAVGEVYVALKRYIADQSPPQAYI